MGKKRHALMKQGLPLFFLLSMALVLISGCYTVKGAVEGSKKDWQSLKDVDQRVREVLW
jgi:hypothetical protein